MRLFLLLTGGGFASLIFSQEVPKPSIEQQEQFLKSAPVKSWKTAKKGITGTSRATLSDGNMTHDASVQLIDERKTKNETQSGVEYNFQDSYKLNIAAYWLGKKLGLESMIPVSVERSFQGKKGSYTWWIDDFAMDEVDRLKRKIHAPDKDRWGRQYLVMKLFDNLIYNVDRNATNILYDKNWSLWMIDHSRSFRRYDKLPDAKAMQQCDRQLLARLKDLNDDDVKAGIGKWVDSGQIQGLLARRKLIIKHCEAMGPSKLYDFLPPK